MHIGIRTLPLFAIGYKCIDNVSRKKRKGITRKRFALIFCISLIKASLADIRIEINIKKKKKERKESAPGEGGRNGGKKDRKESCGGGAGRNNSWRLVRYSNSSSIHVSLPLSLSLSRARAQNEMKKEGKSMRAPACMHRA